MTPEATIAALLVFAVGCLGVIFWSWALEYVAGKRVDDPLQEPENWGRDTAPSPDTSGGI